MITKTRRLTFALALCTAAAPALADEPSELEALLEEKVVTSASKAAETAQSAPATATTVTAEELERHGIRSVGEAVRYLVPGARFAVNFPDAQLVLGASSPVSFTREEKPDVGFFLYLSYEHKYKK